LGAPTPQCRKAPPCRDRDARLGAAYEDLVAQMMGRSTWLLGESWGYFKGFE
jgi:hypothetical protein